MSLMLITPPAEEPVTLADLKAHLRLDTTEEDALLSALIVAARQSIEARFGVAVIAQTWRLALDAAPTRPLALPLSPIASIDAVGVARNGLIEALAPGAYDAQPGLVGRVRFAGTASGDPLGGVVITFTAGWTNAAAAPAELKQAVKILAAHFYEHREGETRAPDIAGIVSPYRRVRL